MSYAAWRQSLDVKPAAARTFDKSFILQNLPLLLLTLALCMELFVPLLAWKTPLPRAARWFGDLSVMLILIVTMAEMLVKDKIPALALLMFGYTLIGATVATYEGQSAAATTWGWWMMFKYPVVGIFVYLQSDWPAQLAELFFRACVAILTLQVVVQLLQYVTGEVPGDNLAGTFGPHGVMPLVSVIFLVSSLGFGHWLVTGKWQMLAYILLLSTISSVLGAMRFYFIFLPILGFLAMMLHLLRGGRFQSVLLYVVLLAVFVPSFIYTYNKLVAEPRGMQNFEELFIDDSSMDYFDKAKYDPDTGEYSLGRNFSVIYGWNSLQRDSTTLVFGYGLGSRGDSSSLNILGAALQNSIYGRAAGTSSLVIIQELGLFGLSLLALVFLWFITVFWRCAGSHTSPHIKMLAYGLIIYTCGWPFWLWYNNSWRYAASMILYWGLCGYVLRQQLTESAAPLAIASER